MNDSDFPELDEAGFETQVLGRAGVSVVDFWSTSCIPCRQMTRLLREIAPELPPQVSIGKVNADANPGLVERYGVRGLPTLLLFKDGVLVETRTGIDRKQVLKKAIESHA
jgi:thioredoxin 1